MISRVDSKENDLKAFSKAADNLHKLLDQYGSDDEDILQSRSTMNERYRGARAKLTERLADVDQMTEKAKQFSDVIKESNKWITGVNEKVEPKFSKGVPKDPAKIEGIIQEIEVRISYLSHHCVLSQCL